MINNIFTGVTAYISTSVDYLLILMAIFSANKNYKLQIYLGDLIGTSILVGISLLLACVLNIVPQTWILGLLGLVPIIMGLKILYNLYINKATDEDDDEVMVQQTLSKNRKLIINVVTITIVTCGADNIGVYVPLFTQLNAPALTTVLITLFVMLTIFYFLGLLITRMPIIANLLEKWGDLITAIVYLLIGTMILTESGTISVLCNFLK